MVAHAAIRISSSDGSLATGGDPWARLFENLPGGLFSDRPEALLPTATGDGRDGPAAPAAPAAPPPTSWVEESAATRRLRGPGGNPRPVRSALESLRRSSTVSSFAPTSFDSMELRPVVRWDATACK